MEDIDRMGIYEDVGSLGLIKYIYYILFQPIVWDNDI